MILQNIHRFFLFLALPFLVFLSQDVYEAMWFTDASGHRSFGIGIGTLILLINVILLSGYTLGCHSFRHSIGGLFDRLSERPIRRRLYDCSSCLNRAHMKWAWCSLVMVAFSDLYIRLCSMGIWHDWRLF